jgi:hypothetical protein
MTKKAIKEVINGQEFRRIKDIAEVYKRFEITDDGYVKVWLGNSQILLGKTSEGIWKVAGIIEGDGRSK